MDGSNAIDRADEGLVETGISPASENTRTLDRRTSTTHHHPGGPKPVAEPPRKSSALRRIILAVLGVAVIGAGADYGYRWWTHDRFFVSTDDAYVSADITQVAAKIAGHIASLEVAENSRVHAGDVIARIDDGDYQLAVRAAQDKLNSQHATIERIGQQIEAARLAVTLAQAQVESARATLTRATADFSRQAELSAQRFASVSALDAARAARDTAAAAVRAAEATVAQAGANVQVCVAQRTEAESTLAELQTTLAKAERDVAFTEIRAPVDGIVGTRAVEVGSYVQAGSRITALVATAATHIDANFKETQIAELKPGAVVDVQADAYDGRVFTGHVASLSPATGAVFSLLPPENATGNFTKVVQRVPVRIDVDDPEGLLRIGLSVVVSVDSRSGS